MLILVSSDTKRDGKDISQLGSQTIGPTGKVTNKEASLLQTLLIYPTMNTGSIDYR